MAYSSLLASKPDPLFERTDRATGLIGKTPLGVVIQLSGHKKLGQAFELLDGAIRSAGNFAALRAAQEIFKRSRDQVPYDTGELYDSAGSGPKKSVTNDNLNEWIVMYDTPYAWFVHETPQAYQQGKGPPSSRGRRWKFVEEPMKEVEAEYLDWVADEINSVIKPITPASPPKPRLVKRST